MRPELTSKKVLPFQNLLAPKGRLTRATMKDKPGMDGTSHHLADKEVTKGIIGWEIFPSSRSPSALNPSQRNENWKPVQTKHQKSRSKLTDQRRFTKEFPPKVP